MGHNRAGDRARVKLRRRRREEKRLAHKSEAEQAPDATLADKLKGAARAVTGKVGEMLHVLKEKTIGTTGDKPSSN
jgi:hypothetical protein